MSLVYLDTDKIMKPPRKLRHIPHVSYYSVIKSLLMKESNWDRAYRLHLSEVNKKEHGGLLLEIGFSGWELHVSNPVDTKRILMKHDMFPKADISNMFHGTLFGKFVFGPNLVILNGHEWKSQRKIANPAFHRSVPVKLFGNSTLEMFQVMENMGSVIDVTDLMERWTLDIIGKAGFGFNFNALSDRDNDWVSRYNVINDGLRDPKHFLFPVLDQKLLWLLHGRKGIHEELDKFLEMIDEVIQEKRTQIKNNVQNKKIEDNERDLLDLMLQSSEDGNGVLTDEELKSNVCLFFVAGHDTTSNALSFAIHYLAQNQEIQQRAREEAIEILGDELKDVLPTIEDTKRMTYISQIMKETLRINPPVVITAPRIAVEDTELSGVFIPKGTTVITDIFDVHHTEKIWKNADRFDPDRFSQNGEAAQNGNGEGNPWFPFGNGARQCIGMNFSLAEQRVMLSMLLRKFTWFTPENSIHKNGVDTAGAIIIGPVDLDIKFYRRY